MGVAVAARDIIHDIPEDAVVSAQYSITAHIAHRKEIYMFPTPFAMRYAAFTRVRISGG